MYIISQEQKKKKRISVSGPATIEKKVETFNPLSAPDRKGFLNCELWRRKEKCDKM